MPLVVPLVLCVVGVVVAMLPPADVRPEEGRSSWFTTWIAMLAAVAVIVFAAHRFHPNEPAAQPASGEVAGNP